jgi:hypothetical protein
MGLNSTAAEERPVVGFCEHGNENLNLKKWKISLLPE